MEGLKGNYHSCGEDIQRNLVEIEERKNEYNPKHRNILEDLITKPKSFYLDGLLDDVDNEKMTSGVNRRINRAIPEKINVIFLNSLLIPTLMAKSMEENRSKCMEIKESLDQKQNKLNDVMVRLGPSEPFSDSIMELLSGFKNYFEGVDENLPSDDDDDEDLNEDKIKGVIDNLVNRSFYNDKEDDNEDDDGDDNEDDDEDDDGDDNEDDEIHHLKIVMDKALKLENEGTEQTEQTEQNGGTSASFF